MKKKHIKKVVVVLFDKQKVMEVQNRGRASN